MICSFKNGLFEGVKMLKVPDDLLTKPTTLWTKTYQKSTFQKKSLFSRNDS